MRDLARPILANPPSAPFRMPNPTIFGAFREWIGGGGEWGRMETAPTTIVSVLYVIDTREYIEEGDRFVPLQGTGQARECDRCGREHEVHAHVVISDGTEAVVGTGCMKGESVDVTRALARGANQAKRRAALNAKLAKLESAMSAMRRISDEVESTEAPEITTTWVEPTSPNGRRIEVAHCGNAQLWLTTRQLTPDVCQELVRTWRYQEVNERLEAETCESTYCLADKLSHVRKQLDRLDRVDA